MTIAQNFPEIAPSLNLSFALTKALDPRITFARASSATYYGTQTAKAEENLLIRSQEFDNTAWAKLRVTVTANDTTAPDGTTTAELIAETTENGVHGVVQNTSFVSGLDYVASVYAKKGTSNFLQIISGNASVWGGRVNFDLDLGTVTTEQTATGTIIDVGNGWYRCSAAFTSGSSTTTSISLIKITTSTATRFESYTGDTANNLFIWGAQLEQRSAVTAYTPTTTQPITNYIPVLETASAGVARFDHSPTTFESLGFLVEEQRTNLLVRSEEFDNASWTKNNTTVTANTLVAPDGTLTGDKLVEDTATSTHRFFQTISSSSGTYTGSIFVKKAERSFFRISLSDLTTGSAAATFNLNDKSFVIVSPSGSWTNISAKIDDVGNDWYRISVTATQGAGSNVRTFFNLINDLGNESYTGDGYSGIYIWGAQLESSGFSTSYIKTVASQVTRSADSASMTGANFTSWYRQDEGTVYSESFSPADSITGIFNHHWTLSQDGNNFVGLISSASFSGSGNNLSVRVNNISQLSIMVGQKGAYNKSVLSLKTNDSKGTANGASVQSDTDCLIPAPTSLHLGGSGFAASNTRSTHIKKFAYYAKALTATQLQAITG